MQKSWKQKTKMLLAFVTLLSGDFGKLNKLNAQNIYGIVAAAKRNSLAINHYHSKKYILNNINGDERW